VPRPYFAAGLVKQSLWQTGACNPPNPANRGAENTYIHTYFISNTAVQNSTYTTLCWEDGNAATALTAALKKKIKKDKH